MLRYFLLVALVLGCLIPSLLSVMKALKPVMSLGWYRLYHALYKVYHATWCQFFCSFPLAYLGGYWLSQQQFTKRQRGLIYSLGIVGVIYTILLSSWLSVLLGKPCGAVYGYLTWNVLAAASAVFVFFKTHWQNWASPAWLGKAANLMFGVYLVHILVFSILTDQLHVRLMAHNPIWFVPALTLLIFAISLICAKILSLIPWVNRHAM